MILKLFGILAAMIMSQPKPVSLQPIESPVKAAVKFTNKDTAELIVNDYERDDVFVADIIADSKHGYLTDPTGESSSTLAIQQAIDDCAALGGGTVYLPHGKYLVTSRIEIKPYVNLRGDYRDPDQVDDGDYGSIIVAGVPSTEAEVGSDYNLFRLQGSTALIGLTFFYPLQFMDNVVPYAYAIEIPGGLTTDYHNVFTIKDVTFINAYRGICASITKNGTMKSVTHEQLHLENIKGTVLREGVHLTNSSEVGAFNGITFNSTYWSEAGKDFNAPDSRNIKDFTAQNSVGMILGDLEWQEIENISISDYHTGIYFHNKTRVVDYPMSFIGSLYNVSIKNATYGVFVEKLYPNMGIEIANSNIDGRIYAVMNCSPETEGHLKLSGVTLNGPVGGNNIYYDTKLQGEIPALKKSRLTYDLPRLYLYNVLAYGADNTGRSDTAAAIQKALNQAGLDGGGVVYLPAGFYRLEKPLRVPAHTQLRGCTSAVQKDLQNNSLGTLLLAYYGHKSSDQALITLDGDLAGVSSLRVCYPQLNIFEKVYTKDTLPSYSYTIKGSGQGIYAVNLYLTGVCKGIDFSENCSAYLIRRVMGAFYQTGFSLGGTDGVLDTCLSNGIAVTKIGSSLINDFDDWNFDPATVLNTHIYPLTRQSTHLIKLTGAKNTKIHNVFTFASNTFIESQDSDFEGLNLGFDSQPSNAGNMFFLDNSTAVAINTLRDSLGTVGTFKTLQNNSVLSVYNRITLLPNNASKTEKNIIANEEQALANMGGAVESIDKIWEQPVQFTFVDYPSAEPDPEPEPTPEPEPGAKSNPVWPIVLGVAAGIVFVAAVVIFLIIKHRR